MFTKLHFLRWYFGKVGDKVAYTNVEVNGLSDWDVNKLGWYKYQNNQYSIRY